MEDEENSNPRPIVRLGLFLISHSFLFSIVSCSVGFIALLLLPILATNTYISENALMPGSGSNVISSHDVSNANKLVQDLSESSLLNPEELGIERRKKLAAYISKLGADVSYHKFCPRLDEFSILHFFSGPDAQQRKLNINCSAHGVNTVGIIRAPRSDGKEAIVIVTPHTFESIIPGETLSLSIGYVVFSLLSRVEWLAKDIIWLVADSKFGDYESVNSWLRKYHTPAFSECSSINNGQDTHRLISDEFLRAGTMAAALVVKADLQNDLKRNSLSIYAEASNGQMPNLDLINIVNFLAVHRQGMHLTIEKFGSLLNCQWLIIIGNVFENLGKMVRNLNPKWNFVIPASDFVDGMATLASSLYRQAMGIPTGSHGPFRDFQVDAITLKINAAAYNSKARQNDLILRSSRLIEGVIRAINNLLEKFHHSFFLYLLTAPGKFISVGIYMIAFAFMVAPLPLVAASLYTNTNHNPSSWKWLNAAKEVFLIHSWGALTLLLPYYLSKIPNFSSENSFATWLFLSLISLHLVYLFMEQGEWRILKSVTITTVFIGLVLMSVINFAAAEIGTALIVPLCLMVRPFRLQENKNIVPILLTVLLAFATFPPATFFCFKGIHKLSVRDYWNWIESLRISNSATYIFIGIVHIPCWALCMRILFYSPERQTCLFRREGRQPYQ